MPSRTLAPWRLGGSIRLQLSRSAARIDQPPLAVRSRARAAAVVGVGGAAGGGADQGAGQGAHEAQALADQRHGALVGGAQLLQHTAELALAAGQPAGL